MSDSPSFLAETPAETAEFEAVRDEKPIPEVAAPAPEPKTAEPAKAPELAKVEPAKAAEPPKEPEKPKPTFVPHAALHEERLKRQALEKELADLRAGQQPEPEKPAEIDPETDPIAALKEIREYQQKQREEGERQKQLTAFDQRVQAHEKDFADATPDYGDAVKFLREARAKQIADAYTAVGRTITQQELGAILLHEARSTSNDALTNGKNPGEVFYTLAKSFGYTGKAAEPAAKVDPPKAPDPEPPAKAAEEAIDRITRGQKAASKVGGGDPPAANGEITLETLATLEGAAFDKAFEKFSKSQRAAH
jgi:hypothetical protein